jgi:hypothetical protein
VGCSERRSQPEDTLNGGDLDDGCCWDHERLGLAERFSNEALRIRSQAPKPPLDDARAVSSTVLVVAFLFLPPKLGSQACHEKSVVMMTKASMTRGYKTEVRHMYGGLARLRNRSKCGATDLIG